MVTCSVYSFILRIILIAFALITAYAYSPNRRMFNSILRLPTVRLNRLNRLNCAHHLRPSGPSAGSRLGGSAGIKTLKEYTIEDRTDPREIFREAATRIWVERFVMGQGMCPWAGGVLVGNKLRIVTVYGDGEGDQILQLTEDVVLEAKGLYDNEHEEDEITTTLIVLPDLKDFDKFLEVVDIIEGLFEQEEIDEFLQVAHFHPDYVFADSTEPENEIENFTNRSPFPLIHLLRVDEVSDAIESYGDTSLIWKNNKVTLRKLGLEKMKAMSAKILVDAEIEAERIMNEDDEGSVKKAGKTEKTEK